MRLMVDEDVAVAERLVGAVGACVSGAWVVAPTTLDQPERLPAPSTARTW